MSSWNQSPYVGYKPPNWRDIPYTPKPTYEDIFGVPESQDAINYRQEQEAKARREAEEKKRAAQAERQRAENARLLAEGKKIAPDYRESYNIGDPQSFRDAKKAADETYMQFWYDKANAISDKWTDQDYRNLAEPKYEKKIVGEGRHAKEENVRVLPKGYDEFLKIKERIDYGVLDFNSEEDHKKLIKPPQTHHGYGKRQYWIDESNPLRQAVEAQSAVMNEWLDEAGVDIVIPYSELDGFNRPDPMRGEGLYLNTGTGAHIDWDSGLKRMQHYQDVGGGFGEYSTAFIRPDPDFGAFGKILSVVGTLTGNPVMRNIGIVAQGGDWKDLAKGYLAGQVTVPILEDTFASLGVDAELLGIDPDTFSDSLMNVQTEMLEGGSGTDALLSEFTEPVVDKVVDVAKEALPDVDLGIDIDFDTPDIIKDIGDVVVAVAEPILETAEDVVKPVIDLAQTVTEPVVDVVKEVAPEVEDIFIDPVKEGLETAIDTVADLGEPVIDAIDEGLDVFGEQVVDPALQTAKELGQDIIDPIDDIIDAVDSPIGNVLELGGDLITGMLAGNISPQSQQSEKTLVENIFDKELFKFDTEIKSTQEMLSPMMNLRRYG